MADMVVLLQPFCPPFLSFHLPKLQFLIKKIKGGKNLGLSALQHIQTNKLKSGRSGTNPIIRENLISLTSVADASVSPLPSPFPVQGQ